MINSFSEGSTFNDRSESRYSPEETDRLRVEFDELLIRAMEECNDVARLIGRSQYSSGEDATKLAIVQEMIEDQLKKDRANMTGEELDQSVTELKSALDNIERIRESYEE